ncbi:MAG: cell division protein FtsQ/DivIB [Ancrocorticia sp.]|uniref:cell division protein FtsQ/DivIB n=1 Tax=Ancrocorticia sp. TaxID=2593684 RepID=UPI003F93A767
MRPPKRPAKPRDLGASKDRHGGGEISHEQVRKARQDAAPTAALSPEEAQRIADSVTGKWQGNKPAAPSRSGRTDDSAGSTESATSAHSAHSGQSPAEPVEAPNAPAASPPLRERLALQKRLRGLTSRVSLKRERRPRRRSTTELSERRLEKQSERRRLILKRVGVLGGGVFLVLTLVWVLFFSSILGLQKDDITVSGLNDQEAVTEAEVIAVVGEWEGSPTLRLPESTIESSLTESFPLIETANVNGQAPHGANVTLTLREPIACLLEDGECVAIDAHGARIPVPEETADALPRLTLDKGQDAAGEAAMSMIEVLDALPAGTRERVESIEVSDTLQMTLKLNGGAEVTWGRAEDNDFKAEVLTVLLEQEADSYDVSVPSAPVTG